MKDLYKHQADNPFHISVGTVLINDKGKIRVHYKTMGTTPEEFLHTMGGLEEAYTLMRESIENGETIEEAVHRGLREEFGADGEVVKYLGAISIPELRARTRTFEKTTLYFLVKIKEEFERPVDDGESHTELRWEEPEFLIRKMKQQGVAADRGDLDESKIIESYLQYGK